MNRDKYQTKSILITHESRVDSAVKIIRSLPVDSVYPIEVVIREQVKQRKQDQNSLMWSGPLTDIANQAYVNGRRYSAVVWHEHFKESFLPEICERDDELKDPSNYEKYAVKPSGERFLIGSTKDLSVKGFSIYLEQVYAYGANLGVMFTANPNQSAA